jgi:hypothetical protein
MKKLAILIIALSILAGCRKKGCDCENLYLDQNSLAFDGNIYKAKNISNTSSEHPFVLAVTADDTASPPVLRIEFSKKPVAGQNKVDLTARNADEVDIEVSRSGNTFYSHNEGQTITVNVNSQNKLEISATGIALTDKSYIQTTRWVSFRVSEP